MYARGAERVAAVDEVARLGPQSSLWAKLGLQEGSATSLEAA